MKMLSVVVLGLVSLVGCGAPMEVDGFHVYKEATEASFAKVKTRAAFDMGCSADKLKLTIVGVTAGGFAGDVPSQIGVQGCDHKAVYVHAPDGNWVLNSNDTGEK
jgi:hypothetical protein